MGLGSSPSRRECLSPEAAALVHPLPTIAISDQRDHRSSSKVALCVWFLGQTGGREARPGGPFKMLQLQSKVCLRGRRARSSTVGSEDRNEDDSHFWPGFFLGLFDRTSQVKQTRNGVHHQKVAVLGLLANKVLGWHTQSGLKSLLSPLNQSYQGSPPPCRDRTMSVNNVMMSVLPWSLLGRMVHAPRKAQLGVYVSLLSYHTDKGQGGGVGGG